MLNEESKSKIKEFAREMKALLDQKDLIFWQGGIVRVAPVGAPPVFCTVEIQGIWDENVEWRGTPGGLVAGDAVLVWEDPVTHRREIIGASGGGACTPFVHDHSTLIQGGDALNPATFSPQTFVVGPAPCLYPTVSAAVVAVNAFGPTAANPCTIRVQGCVTTEPAALMIPQYCNLEGVGEGSIVDLQAQYVDFDDYTSALDIVFTSSRVGAAIVNIAGETDVELRNVKGIATNGGRCFTVASSTNIRLFDCIAEATLANSQGFRISGTSSDVDLEGCTADTTNFAYGLYVGNTASVITKFCTFKGTIDVRVEATAAWEDVSSRLNYGLCQLLGTITHLPQSIPASDTFAFRAKNTSGGAASRGNVGYIDEAGEYKTTTTAYLDAAWCVILVGGANNADIYWAKRGRPIVTLNGNCNVGDFLYTSTTAGQAQPQSYSRPELFAVALTANAAGAGGTCEALLLCETTPRNVVSNNYILRTSVAVGDTDWNGTIATLPGGAVLTYNHVSGDENVLIPYGATTLAKLRLYNSTRGTYGLIQASVAGTNTITLTAAVPGGWQVGDTITIRSQVNLNVDAGAYFLDWEITSSEIPVLARSIDVDLWSLDTTAAATRAILHTWEAYSATKRVIAQGTVINRDVFRYGTVNLFQRRFTYRCSSNAAADRTYYLSIQKVNVATP